MLFGGAYGPNQVGYQTLAGLHKRLPDKYQGLLHPAKEKQLVHSCASSSTHSFIVKRTTP